jgi:hypothetical protein
MNRYLARTAFALETLGAVVSALVTGVIFALLGILIWGC